MAIIDPVTAKILASFFVLAVGFAFAKLVEKLITLMVRRIRKARLQRPLVARLFFYIIATLTIIIALGFLEVTFSADTFYELYSYIPTLISFILLFILLMFFIRFIMYLVNRFLYRTGLCQFIEEYQKENLLDIGLFIFRIILYVLGIFGILNLSGIDITGATTFAEFIFYPVFILFLLLLFFGLKDFAANMIVGFYLRSIQFLRKGEYIRVYKQNIKVHKMNSTGIITDTQDDYQRFIPYKVIMEKGIAFRKINTEISTLEKIKQNFVAQHPSYCGPASISMILKVFGYDFTQEEIGKAAKTKVSRHGEPAGTTPKDLINAAQKLTKQKVKGVWIDVGSITDLKNEIKAWLHGEALVIVDYKKSYLFPDAKKAHYSVCLSVNGDELLLLDPSTVTGGVYYVDYRRVYAGMDTYSKIIGGKRGYLVLAPDGTPAYDRITEGLFYAEPSFYKNLTKKLEKNLDGIFSMIFSIEHVMPKKVQSFMKKAHKNEKVARIWKP